jgi:hypothetical protein
MSSVIFNFNVDFAKTSTCQTNKVFRPFLLFIKKRKYMKNNKYIPLPLSISPFQSRGTSICFPIPPPPRPPPPKGGADFILYPTDPFGQGKSGGGGGEKIYREVKKISGNTKLQRNLLRSRQSQRAS